jgi:hypothetical protein
MVSVLLLVGGCASMPDVTVQYYFPRAQTQLQLTESLACDGTKKLLTVASVAATTVYSSDAQAKMGTLQYSKVSGPFTDTDLTVSFTDDGRLLAINATSTGQGDTILKDILSFAAVVRIVPAPPASPPSEDELCAAITATAGGAGKAVSFTYKAAIVYQATGGNPYDPGDPGARFEPDDRSDLYQKLAAYRQGKAYAIRISTDPDVQAGAKCGDSGHPENCKLTAMFGNNGCPIAAPYVELNRYVTTRVEVKKPSGDTLWKSDIPIPVRGDQDTHYCLPIPAAPVFGGQTFGMQLSAYGSIQKLEYGKKTGVQDATDSASALANALKGPSAATQAASLKAQADLIAQQQRLVECQANPANCKP